MAYRLYDLKMVEQYKQIKSIIPGQLNDDYLTPHKCHNPTLVYLRRKINNNLLIISLF